MPVVNLGPSGLLFGLRRRVAQATGPSSGECRERPGRRFRRDVRGVAQGEALREGSDHRGHDRRDRPRGGVRRRRRQGRSDDRDRGAEGRRRRHRGRGRRPHPGRGGVDRGRADTLAEAGARRRDRPAARGRVPRRSASGRQGREGGEGRLRGAHRPAARLLPDLADRHSSATDPSAHEGRVYAFRIIEYKEGGRNLVVSRRALLEEEQQASAAEVRRIDRRRRGADRARHLGARVRRVRRPGRRRAGAAPRVRDGVVPRVGHLADRRRPARRSPSRSCASTTTSRRSRSG